MQRLKSLQTSRSYCVGDKSDFILFFSWLYDFYRAGGRGGISDPRYVKHSNTIDQLLLNGLETPLLSCCGRLIQVFIISNKDLLYISPAIFANRNKSLSNAWQFLLLLLDCDR